MHLTQALAIHSHVILISQFYSFNPVPTACVFKHNISSMQWTLSFKIFTDHINHLIIYSMVTQASLTMTNKGWKYMYLGRNIRDFKQLLNILHSHLWHLTWELEKADKKNSTFNPCLSSLTRYVCKNIYIT